MLCLRRGKAGVLHLFLLMIACSTFGMQATACQAQDNDNAQRLAESFETWLQVEEQTGGNYEYSVILTSEEAGWGQETNFVFRNGDIAERRYREFRLREERPDWTWTETGDSLGSHEGVAPLKTVDELYAEAAELISRELAPHERLYLYFNDEGILRICTILDTRRVDDDNGEGVIISSISW